LHISSQTLLYRKDDFANPFFIASFL